MNIKKMREEFEDWFSRTYPLTNRESTQSEILCKMIAEQAWKASREALVIELPEIIDKDWANTYAERDAMRDAIRLCKKRIEAAGMKVKV